MSQFSDFLFSLGGLHDSVVISIDWQIESNTLEFTLDDLYANFHGLPEYPGRHGGAIKFQGVSQVDFSVNSSEKLRIFEILPAECHTNKIVAKFSPGGMLTICFVSVVFPAIALRNVTDV